MRKLKCEVFDQPIAEKAVIADDGTEYVELIEETVYVQVGDSVVFGGSGGATYLMHFTQANLVGDLLSVTHGLLAPDGVVNIVLVDSMKDQVEPSNVKFINENLAHVSLEGYTPITSIWTVRVN